MPVFRNNRAAVLEIEAVHNYRACSVESRRIQPGVLFVAHSGAIPAHWMEQGDQLEGETPWVTMVSASPTDEEISQLNGEAGG